MKNENKEAKICGLRQNCYVVDTNDNSKNRHIEPRKYYASLEKRMLPNGYVFELEKVEYPINSETVTSYIDSADYRRDPMAAIANAPKRVNLGDISEVQNFIATNPQEAVRMYRAVGEQLEKYYQNLEKGSVNANTSQSAQGEQK